MKRTHEWMIPGLALGLLVLSLMVARAQQPPKPAEPARPQPQSSAEAFKAAEESYASGDCEASLNAFRNFQTNFTFSAYTPLAIYYEGWSLFCLEQYPEASAVFERLIKGYPNHQIIPEAWLKHAECYRELKDYTKAAGLYAEFQTKFKDHAFSDQAALGQAWMYYKLATEKKKEDPELAKKNFAIAKRIAQGVRAKFSAEEAAKLDSLFLLGQILTDEGDFDGARAIYREMAAQANNPRATEALFLAAETMYEAKRYTDAVTYYERVLPKSVLLERIDAETQKLVSDRGEYIRQNALGVYQLKMQALAELRKKISDRPDLRASALFRIANCYQQLAKPQEASVVYRHFMRIYPSDTLEEREKRLFEQAWYSLTQSLTESGRSGEAEQELKQFKDTFGDSPLVGGAEVLTAITKFDNEKYGEALEAFQKILDSGDKKEPSVLELAQLRVADCQFGLKQYDKAIAGYAEFLKKYPESQGVEEAMFRTGRSYFEKAQIAQRENDQEKFQANLTEAANAYEALRQKKPDGPMMPEVTFQLGYLYAFLGVFDKANYEKAITAFREFVTKWKDNSLVPEALYQIAHNHLSLSQYDQAVAAYQQLVDQFPANPLAPHAAFEIGSAWATANDAQKMIDGFRAYVQKFPDHDRVPDAMFAIAAVLESLKKHDEARAAYQDLINRAAAQGNNPGENWMRAALAGQLKLAAMLEQKSESDAAVGECEKFLAKFSQNPLAAREMITQIAAILSRAGQVEAAYAKFEELGKQYLQNKTVRVMCTSSAIELALNQKDCRRAYELALKLMADPEKNNLPAPAYLAIGRGFLCTDKYEQTRDVLNQLLSMYPDDQKVVPSAQLGLGQALYALKDLTGAQQAIETMLASTGPDHPERCAAQLWMAKVYYGLDQGKPATSDLNVKATDALNEVLANCKKEAAEASYLLGKFFLSQESDPQAGKENCKTALAYFVRVAFLAGGEMGEESSYRQGECLECLGDPEGARNVYRTYLRRYPEGKGKFFKDAQERLNALPPPPPAK